MVQSGLRDNPSVSEPSSVGLNSTHLVAHLLFGLLEGGGLDDLSISISDGLASVEHLDLGCGFRISVKVFSCQMDARG